MIGSVERYSSTPHKRRLGVLGSRAVRVVLITLILYIIVSAFFVRTFHIDSVSMSPTLNPSDRVLASCITFGARIPFTGIRLPAVHTPARGDLVVVQPPYFSDDAPLKRIIEPFVNFLTFQRATAYREFGGARAQGYLVKRVIGVPGDTLRIRGYTVMIRRQGSVEFVPEDEVLGVDYAIAIGTGLGEKLPLSGNGAEIALKSGEYFVLGDNRPDSSDSRSWGPVKESRILAKVIFRYWPLSGFGKL